MGRTVGGLTTHRLSMFTAGIKCLFLQVAVEIRIQISHLSDIRTLTEIM